MKRPLRVLHVYRTYFPDPPGGLQEAIRQICLAVRPFGIESTVFTLSPHPEPPTLERPEGRVRRSRSWAAPASCDLGGIGAFRTFAALAGASDVVHYHFPWPFADALRLWAPPGVPAVMTYHSDVVRQRLLGWLYSPLMWRTLGGMRAIVADSPPYVPTSPVLSDSRIAAKVRAIPLGICEESYPRNGDAGVFGRIGLDPDQPYILFIGVLRYYKGLHTLVEAAPRVGAPVVIAGSGPERERLQMQVRRVGADNVVFAGQVSLEEKVALLKRARALVLPSHLRSEAFGMVLVEGAMHSRPLISCEIGTGTSFVNAHGETGLVVAPEDAASLAAAMLRLLGDDALAHGMGRAARARYERLFSGKALGVAYADLYREVVGDPAT